MSSNPEEGTGPDSGPSPSGTQNPKKGKKRVGWQSHSSTRGLSGDEEEVALVDMSPVMSHDAAMRMTPPGAPDAIELSKALTRVLSNEEQHILRAHQDTSPPSASPEPVTPSLRPPRPVLRRDTSYDGKKDRQAADAMENTASTRQMDALNHARFRADRLAKSVGTYSHSAPASRRNSSDGLLPTFQTGAGPGSSGIWNGELTGQGVDDDDDTDHDERPYSSREFSNPSSSEYASAAATPPDASAAAAAATAHIHARDGLRHRFGSREDAAARFPSSSSPLQLSDHEADHDLAEQLVRFHTRQNRERADLFQHKPHWASTTSLSGTSTPQQFDQEADYVPRPAQFRGGVLASLLKLHRDAGERHGRGGGSGGSSGADTPSAPATPVMSPWSSPSSSRPSSPTRKQQHTRRGSGLRSPISSVSGLYRAKRGSSRPGSGLFSHHHSSSSLTLTELMKSSSSMFTAPVSNEVSDKVTAKIKREKDTSSSKPKKEQIRITVHIAGIIARHRYLIKLCRALMMYGAPTHRLEEYMIMSSRVLEIEGQFLYIPSCMIISFDDSNTHTTEVKVVRVPQGIDLGKLRDVHDIYKDVVHDKVGVEEATRRLDKVMRRKPKFNVWFRVFLYGIASASVAPFAFEGRFIDLPIAFLLGCLLGVMQLVFAPSNELYSHVFEVSAAVITSFLARGFGSIQGGELFCFSALAQSSIALILPGYMVLCSSLELQSHNIVAGSVRMVYAMIYTLFLGYGITIGASLYGMFDRHATSATHCDAPLDRGWYFLFVPAFTMCLCLINQAKWSQTPTMLVMALAGFCVNSYSSEYFEGNTQISNMLGALTVGILANLYSRLGKHAETMWLKITYYWEDNIYPRFSRKPKMMTWPTSANTLGDPESRPGSPDIQARRDSRASRRVGYSLAAAAMLPAIFVQVPSGLAAGGSLLAGITSADQINGNSTAGQVATGTNTMGNLDGTAFNVLLSVIQVAIGISVGLFISALIVYPLGKRRSGLFSF